VSELQEGRRAAAKKFFAEERQRIAEERKLGAERLERERWWYVLLALISNGVLVAVISAVVAHLRR